MPSLLKTNPPLINTKIEEKLKPKNTTDTDINLILSKKRRHSSIFPLPSNINITKMKKGVKQSYVPLTKEALDLMEQIQEASLKIDLSLQKERSNLLKYLSELKDEKEELSTCFSQEEDVYIAKVQSLKEQIKQENAHFASLAHSEDHLSQNIMTKAQLVVNAITQESLFSKLGKIKKELQEQYDSIAAKRKNINDDLMNHFKVMMTNKVLLQAELAGLEGIRNEMIARKFAIEQLNKNQKEADEDSNDTLNLEEENTEMRIKINNFAIDEATVDNIKNVSKSFASMNELYNNKNNNNISKIENQELKQFSLF